MQGWCAWVGCSMTPAHPPVAGRASRCPVERNAPRKMMMIALRAAAVQSGASTMKCDSVVFRRKQRTRRLALLSAKILGWGFHSELGSSDHSLCTSCSVVRGSHDARWPPCYFFFLSVQASMSLLLHGLDIPAWRGVLQLLWTLVSPQFSYDLKSLVHCILQEFRHLVLFATSSMLS